VKVSDKKEVLPPSVPV